MSAKPRKLTAEQQVIKEMVGQLTVLMCVRCGVEWWEPGPEDEDVTTFCEKSGEDRLGHRWVRVSR